MTSRAQKYLSSEAIRGYTMVSENNASGVLVDIFFNDVDGVVRHVVFDTARWLSTNLLLMKPEELVSVDHRSRQFMIGVTFEEYLTRPPVHEDLTVSRQHDALGGIDDRRGSWSPFVRRKISDYGAMCKGDDTFDPNLRSAREIVGYSIEARDGDAGEITDILLDQTDWRVHYYVVATGSLLHRRQKLLHLSDVDEIDWKNKAVSTSLVTDAIEHFPEFDRAQQTLSTRRREVNDQFLAIFGDESKDRST